MSKVTREQLSAYLDDALSDFETAQVEQALRSSAALRRELRELIQRHDRGEHSRGAIWRRHRLSCPTREQLGSYLLGALDRGCRDYIRFHLDIVACAYCHANLADLRSRQKEAPAKVKERRRRFFDSSAGLVGA